MLASNLNESMPCMGWRCSMIKSMNKTDRSQGSKDGNMLATLRTSIMLTYRTVKRECRWTFPNDREGIR